MNPEKLKSKTDMIRSIPRGGSRSFPCESIAECESMKGIAYRLSGYHPDTGIKYSASVNKETRTVTISRVDYAKSLS